MLKLKRSVILPLLWVVMILPGMGFAMAGNGTPAAPDFTLKSLSGENIRLGDYRGQVVLLNFWASWCAPCRQEMPLLNDLHRRYAALGFSVIGVNVEQDDTAARRWLEKTPVDFPILFDTDNRVSQRYDIRAMPTTVLIDRDGNVRHLHHGYVPGLEATYQQQARELIRE